MAAQLAMIGAWDVGPFLDDIRREEFALGFLTFDLMKDQYDKARFTPAIIEALREHYRPSEQIGAYHLYRPAHTNPSPVSEGRTEAMQLTHGKDPCD